MWAEVYQPRLYLVIWARPVPGVPLGRHWLPTWSSCSLSNVSHFSFCLCSNSQQINKLFQEELRLLFLKKILLLSYFLRTLSSGWMNSFRYRDPLHYIVHVCPAVKILRRRSSDFSAVSPPAASPCITCHCRSLSPADPLDCHVTEATFLLHLGW